MNKFFVILTFLTLSLQAQKPLSSLEAQELRKLVKTQASKTNTMRLDFVQYKHMDFLSNDIETSGNLLFKKPNLVKWQYTNPFSYSVLFKDNTLHINDNGKKSDVNLGSNKLFGKLNDLIVNSITGDLFDETQFDISYYKSNDGYEVFFKPKDGKLKKYISEFQLFFNAQAFVDKLKMVEPSGDYTTIVFSNRQMNISIAHAVFTD